MLDSSINMWCPESDDRGYDGYNAHPRDASYVIILPFLEAIHRPPECKLHKRPYLTKGGCIVFSVAEAFRKHGVNWECDERLNRWCHNHGYHGEDWTEGRCGFRQIVDWIKRRHEYVDTQVLINL